MSGLGLIAHCMRKSKQRRAAGRRAAYSRVNDAHQPAKFVMSYRHNTRMQRRTWFGGRAVVELGPGFLHRAGYGRLLVPHPPLINWLLRRGLERHATQSLELDHEFGHLQSLPLVVGYGAALFVAVSQVRALAPSEIVLCVLSAFAGWEVYAELYAMWRSGARYAAHYHNVSRVPRTIFWTLSLGLVLAGWLLLLPI